MPAGAQEAVVNARPPMADESPHPASSEPRAPVFLLTIDIHPRLALREDLSGCLEYLLRHGLRATFFLPAVLVAEYDLAPVLRRAVAEGHQIACHGMLHRPPEDFVADSFETQRRALAQAKTIIEDAVEKGVTAFRAPTFRVSSTTMVALEATGFEVDLSVCPQRLSLISSQPGNLSWLLAPRSPYHPSYRSPFRRGEMRLWELPNSSCVIPFTSLVYQSLGQRAARTLARLFFEEGRRTGRPIVFTCHPEEFVPSDYVRPSVPKTLGAFVPRRSGGLAMRYWFYERDESKIFNGHMAMMRYLEDLPGITYVTVDEWLQGPGPRSAVPPAAGSAVVVDG